MYCRNCGKEISNGTNFCNYCGAAQNNSSAQDTQSFYQTNEAQHPPVDSQPEYAEPRSPKKKSKGSHRFIIPIAVVVVAFVIGYFATGANNVKAPTAFDTPTVHDPVDLPSPSINEDAMKDGSTEYLEKTFRLSNEYVEIRNMSTSYISYTKPFLQSLKCLKPLKNQAFCLRRVEMCDIILVQRLH